MTTYTTSLKFNQIANGDQSGVWGTTTNTNWELTEQAITGVQTITMINADYTLTDLNGALDEARNMVIVATGSLSATYQIIAPLANKLYLVSNETAGGFDITVGGSGATVTVPNGFSVLMYCDGTDFLSGPTASYGDSVMQGNLGVDGNVLIGGQLGTSGNVSVGGDLTVTGATNIVPVGCIMAYPATPVPGGFLQCAGQAVSRGTYADLFALIGTVFGSGDGSTTFNLPNIPDLITGVVYMIKY
jgi:hypothetical protein